MEALKTGSRVALSEEGRHRYSDDSLNPHYMMGTITGRDRDDWRVEWANGEENLYHSNDLALVGAKFKGGSVGSWRLEFDFAEAYRIAKTGVLVRPVGSTLSFDQEDFDSPQTGWLTEVVLGKWEIAEQQPPKGPIKRFKQGDNVIKADLRATGIVLGYDRRGRLYVDINAVDGVLAYEEGEWNLLEKDS